MWSLRQELCLPQGIQPRALQNPSTTILEQIHIEKVKLDEKLERENNEILHGFLKSFIEKLKDTDATFEQIYKHVYFTGSYYSDLRIRIPDEFDLNLLLELPKGVKDVTYHLQVPSYMKYRIEDTSILEKVPGLCKLFEGQYLMPEKVRKWLQSVVDKALITYQPPHQIEKIVPRAAGPARNLTLYKRGGGVIDIDLVPVFQAPPSQIKPPGMKHAVKEKVPNDLRCFLVPKPYQPKKQAPVNDDERARLWRAHYPDAEKAVLKGRHCAKSIIRLLKLLRDQENWVVLASYYLKTVVLWHIIANPGEEDWKMNKIGERFLEVLKMLLKYIQERKIEYFFSSRYNLLEKLSEGEAFNLGNRLAGIIRNIEKDSWELWRIFRCTPTFDKPLTMA